MARIFADEDIESLVRRFPPLTLANTTKARPTLLSSNSGNSLVSPAKSLSRFETLLDQGNARISKSDISGLLGIEEGGEQLILGETSVFIYLSSDGRSIIPFPLADAIHEDLNARALGSFVDLHTFAREQDIRIEGIQRWIKFDVSKDWRSFEIDDRVFLCKRSLSDDIESRIRHAITTTGSEICDLTDVFDDDVQTPILKELAEDMTRGQDGDVVLERGHVVWIPSDYSNVAEERARTAQLAHIQQLASELEDRRYCVVELSNLGVTGTELDLEGLQGEVRELFRQWHPENAELRDVSFTDRRDSESRLLIDPLVLEHELEVLKTAAAASVEAHAQQQENLPETNAVTQSVLEECETSDSRRLSGLILRTELADEVRLAVDAELHRLVTAEREKLLQMIEARLLLPFQLYTTGISTIKDATLRQHLEDFVYEHFRREVVPQTLKAAQDLKALREKSSQREVEKLRLAVVDAKSLAALQAGISKFSKKMKITPASSESLQTAKVRTLQSALKSMRQMTRGSDVLQNLIWILLAQKSDGLFMSAGKDTSRMIKQYEAVGEGEIATRLVKWKDLLKTGEDSKDDLEQMRAAAKAAVNEVISSGSR